MTDRPRVVAHEVHRLEIPVDLSYDEFRNRYEQAVPAFDLDRYAGLDPHDIDWATVQATTEFTGELRELAGGTGRFIEALAAELDVRHGTTVMRVDSGPDDVEGQQTPWRAGSVILACTADVAVEVWPEAPAPVAEYLRSVEYSRIDYVYLQTRERIALQAEGRPVRMEVVTTPEVADRTIGGIYAANDWVDEGGLLLVTAAHAAHAENLDDDALLGRLEADVEKLHPEVVGQITERIVVRHPYYTPTMGPGSIRRMIAARDELPYRRVDLAGDHMTAPWMEGAIRSAEIAADRLTR